VDPAAGAAEMSEPAPILAAHNLKVKLGGVAVLDIPSFSLYEKEILTIVGPNGSGKSTLLLTLAGLLKAEEGQLSFRGEALDSHDATFRFRRRISMVFQEPLLFDATVYQNVAAGLKIRGFSKNEIKQRVQKYLQCLRCEHLADRSARKLSGGESQRVGLARAFAIEPEIILLDEPFSSLDPPTRHALIRDLDAIVKETGTTAVMVTHVESEALSLSDRIMVMNDGKAVQLGNPSAVRNNPSNEFVAKFVGMETVLSGRVLECLDEELVISVMGNKFYAAGQAAPGEEVQCGIRPENVLVDIPGASGPRDHSNVFEGRISNVYSVGPFWKLSLDCGFPLVSLVTRDLFDDLKLSEGKVVCASFKPSSIHIIYTHRNY
jgi:tungstate transport system ATP-binding protein